jgi:hypothetical protein
MTPKWRKRLQKLADLVFELPLGCYSFWPSLEHEPLIIGVVLRFSFCSPWQVKQHPRILEVERELRTVWKSEDGDPRSLLFELCQLPGVLNGVPLGLVR